MPCARVALKIYSELLGCAVSFAAFLWVTFQLYVLSQTSEDQTDLLMARYLDISFGLLAFSSALALMYGAFVESKTWLSVWTLGSVTVLVGLWVWYFHRKYTSQPHPDADGDAKTVGIVLSIIYVAAILPVLVYYRQLESWNLFSKPLCNNRWTWCSPLFLSAFANTTSASVGSSSNNSSCSHSRHRISHHVTCLPEGYKIPVAKEEDLYNPV